jgi:hypothetical protein
MVQQPGLQVNVQQRAKSQVHSCTHMVTSSYSVCSISKCCYAGTPAVQDVATAAGDARIALAALHKQAETYCKLSSRQQAGKQPWQRKQSAPANCLAESQQATN